ncbi:flavoprotein [Actinoplanes sp. NPDC048796]|uniref:flavoprotein n=1 Tax=unclassified Actinoplanes TaxID=2626549 RepID=UPI0033EEFB98
MGSAGTTVGGMTKLLVGASGSASVAGLPAYLDALRIDLGATVTVVMTRSARLFLPEQTVALHADRVVTGEDPRRWPSDNQAALAGSHDAVLILPATANMLSVAASGAAPNLLGGVILAAAVPVVFFPMMSPPMLAKAAVGRTIERLRQDGYRVVDPVRTARGPSLPSPAEVVAATKEALG